MTKQIKYCAPCTHGIRVKSVGVEKFKQHANNIGESMSLHYSRDLKELLNSLPDWVISEKPQPCKQMVIRHLTPTQVNKLKAVAEYASVDLSSFVKVVLTLGLINKKAS